MPRLLESLGLARGDGRYARMLKSLARVRLLILDDWGITPLIAEQRRDLLEIVDDRHGRASTIVTGQLPVERWHEHIGNPTIADAVLDRLVLSLHRLPLKGECPPQPPDERWHEHIGNPTIADAVLDRLVHSAHRLELKGESLRKLQAVRNAKRDEAAGS